MLVNTCDCIGNWKAVDWPIIMSPPVQLDCCMLWDVDDVDDEDEADQTISKSSLLKAGVYEV